MCLARMPQNNVRLSGFEGLSNIIRRVSHGHEYPFPDRNNHSNKHSSKTNARTICESGLLLLFWYPGLPLSQHDADTACTTSPRFTSGRVYRARVLEINWRAAAN